MLRESSITISSLAESDIIDVLEEISSSCVSRLSIKKAVKVFCRLTSEGLLTYAREARDLGTLIISKQEISSRMRTGGLRERVADALAAFESSVLSSWPFMPGSHSWLEVEVSTEEKKIFVNRAVRLSSLGRENIKSSPKSSKLMESLARSRLKDAGWEIVFLSENVVPLSCDVIQAYKDTVVDRKEVVSQLLECNDCPDVFYMYSRSGKIRVVMGGDLEKKPALPIPIVGVVK